MHSRLKTSSGKKVAAPVDRDCGCPVRFRKLRLLAPLPDQAISQHHCAHRNSSPHSKNNNTPEKSHMKRSHFR